MKLKYKKSVLLLLAIIGLFFIYKKGYSESNENIIQPLNHQGNIAFKDPEKAIIFYDRFILHNSNSVYVYQIYVKKAQALNKLARYQDAINTLDVAIGLNPKKEDAYLTKIDSLLQLNEKDEVINVLEEILELNPNSQHKQFLNQLREEGDE